MGHTISQTVLLRCYTCEEVFSRVDRLSCSLAATAWASDELSNRRAPGFSLPDSDLKHHDLYDYRGKIVLLNIMKTTCPHCSSFSKVLAQIQQKYQDRRIQVLSIVNSPPETQATVAQYHSRKSLQDNVILFDCGQVAISYLRLTPERPRFEVPHVFIIDQKGWIKEEYRYKLSNRGIFEGKDLFPIVEKYVSQTPALQADDEPLPRQ